MREEIPPQQQELVKKMVGISAGCMVFMAAMLMFFSEQVMQMTGMDQFMMNMISGALLFFAIGDLILIKFLFKDTNRR